MRSGALEGRGLALARRLPPVDGFLAVLFMLIIDFPTTFNLGGNSLSALITLAVPVLLAAVLLVNLVIASNGLDTDSRAAFRAGLARVPLLLKLFVVYAVVRLVMDPNQPAIQVVFVYLMFVLGMLVAVTSLRYDYRGIAKMMAYAAAMAALIYIFQQLFLTVGDERRPIFSDRAFAMTCLVAIAVLIPAGRPSPLPGEEIETPESARRRRLRPPSNLLWTAFIMGALVFSLSRTASAVGAFLCLFVAVRVRRSLRLAAGFAGVVAMVGVALGAVVLYPPLLARFTEGDNVQVGGLTVNTSGRSELWRITWESAIQAPIWGHGPGNSKLVVERGFPIPGTDHPHSDYLRMFNDLGIVGVVLFWGGVFLLLWRCFMLARRHDEQRHWSAVLALLAVVMLSITDNVIVYQFVMMPIGILVGIALRPTAEAVPRSYDLRPRVQRVGRVAHAGRGAPRAEGTR